ncbi:hypothetical protein M413DRAFT_166985 [Hebeloma cylindrosporum]|uniref:Uncharacterized protein n=1 Tax=Hebeloma cylindrosporum TaxID=76867 RepID=A0A0C3BVT6_HEBCY|nr:hypothetical protein M413DRAFT_166985 [Hebeloma cylindrosporum h7]
MVEFYSTTNYIPMRNSGLGLGTFGRLIDSHVRSKPRMVVSAHVARIFRSRPH